MMGPVLRGSASRRAAEGTLLLAVALATLAPPVAGQAMDPPMSLQWWHPVAAGGGIAALFLIDEPIRDFLQDNRSDGLDDFGDFGARMKDPEVFAISGLGTIGVGLIAGQPKVTVTGAQILAAYGISSWMMIGTKWAFGRARPSQEPDDPAVFNWFGGGEEAAFPSGSSAVVFSLATTVADAVDRKPVSILLYSAATVNAWARLNADRHWLSDVALGAVYGITAAKLVNGEWTVFGLRLPSVWTDGRSAGISYRLSH